MENGEKNIYFTNEALARFVAAQGRIIEKVVCHLWQNNMNKSEVVEIIDNVEFHFTDSQKLTVACNADGDGLDAIDYDAKAAAIELKNEFDGKIKLFAIDASTTKMWEGVIGKKLEKIRVSRDGEYYKADSIILDVEDERREISISPLDGLVLDYYEE